MRLVDGKSFFASDISELSHYSLLRYRLAQFLEELRIEDQDLRALIDKGERKEIKTFLNKFYNDYVQDYPRAHYAFSEAGGGDCRCKESYPESHDGRAAGTRCNHDTDAVLEVLIFLQ